MKMNALETAVMNNPLRAAIQRRYEAALFERLGGRLDGQKVLEIGCGRGVGTEILFERFGAREVHAFDLDPRMIERARRRFRAFDTDRLRLFVGDVEAIHAPDDSYDAVIDFGILHHVPAWRNALAEVRRVLKPGGKFFFEEVTRQALSRWVYRTFFDHPRDDRFSPAEFIEELEARQMLVGPNHRTLLFGEFFTGVATKTDRGSPAP